MHDSPLAVVAELILLLSIILVAAKIGGEVSERYLKIPPVLGELGAGTVSYTHLTLPPSDLV